MASCSAMLQAAGANPALVDGLLKDPNFMGGCLQAAEIEHAAHIQAVAAVHVGWMTIGAGFLTIVAAVIGGLVALKSVRIQIALTERQHTSRALTYAYQLDWALVAAIQNVDEMGRILRLHEQGRSIIVSTIDLSALTDLHGELSFANLDRHHLLSSEVVRAMVYLKNKIESMMAYFAKMTDIIANESADTESERNFALTAIHRNAVESSLNELKDQLTKWLNENDTSRQGTR